MKSAKPSIGTSKRPRGEASIAALASGDQHAAEDIPMDLTAVMDPNVNDTADPIVASPLSLRAMMETFITTQTAH